MINLTALRLALLALLTSVLLAACGAPQPARTRTAPAVTTAAVGAAITVQDGLGRTLTFERPPTRIVAIYNDNFGMLATLGVKPVATLTNPEMLSDPIYFDGDTADIGRIKTDGAGIDFEDVASYTPDLVLVGGEEEVTALSGIAPAFAAFSPANLDELYTATRVYGRLLGREAEAEAAIAHFTSRYDAYAQRAPKDVGAIVKIGALDDQKFAIASSADPICQILDRVASCDVPDPTNDDSWSFEVSIEALLDINPDVLMLNNWSSTSDAALRAGLEQNALWRELKAVKAGRVLSTPGYNNPIASSLPAATKFLDTYLPLIYPEVFPQPLTDAQVRDIVER